MVAAGLSEILLPIYRGTEFTVIYAFVGIIPLTFSDKFYTLVCYLHVYNMQVNGGCRIIRDFIATGKKMT
jgi:hypothetical protein